MCSFENISLKIQFILLRLSDQLLLKKKAKEMLKRLVLKLKNLASLVFKMPVFSVVRRRKNIRETLKSINWSSLNKLHGVACIDLQFTGPYIYTNLYI